MSNRLQATVSPLPAVPIAVLHRSQQPGRGIRLDLTKVDDRGLLAAADRAAGGAASWPARRGHGANHIDDVERRRWHFHCHGNGCSPREPGDEPRRPPHRHAVARAHGRARHGQLSHWDAVRRYVIATALEPPPFDPLVGSGEITITPAHRSPARRRGRGGLRSSGEGGIVWVLRPDRYRTCEIQRSKEIEGGR